jgi:enoyl-CoA hydratase/carnithine racemase
MSINVLRDLDECLKVAADDQNVKVVVLTGAGDVAFSAGADLTGIDGNDGALAAHDSRGLLASVFRGLWQLGKPSIARVRGYALAGGFGLALACDFVIAGEDAQFGTPEIDVGLWPYMITVPLLRSMPMRFALELMMTGRRVLPEEAMRVGIVNRVVPVEELDAAVESLAATLSGKAPSTMRLGKRSFYQAAQMTTDDALDYLQAMLTVTTMTADTAEGLAAFREKRTPRWSGR